MKNANIFVDVDLTLIDMQSRPIPGVCESIRKLHAAGCHLFLWSTGGMDYARTTAMRLGIADLFEGFVPKPDIIIDDMPTTATNPIVFNPSTESSWEDMTARLIRKHID